MVRAVENVEIACGMPMMAKGEIVEDIAPGIDEMMLRQPVGVCASIAPFNFPGMIAFWYLPYAVACGNTIIIKPSREGAAEHAAHLRASRGRWISQGRGESGKRRQGRRRSRSWTHRTSGQSRLWAQRRRRSTSTRGRRQTASVCRRRAERRIRSWSCRTQTWRWPRKIVADSAFGCAGQRCLAVSLAVTVAEAHDPFMERICDAAALACRRAMALIPAWRWAPSSTRPARSGSRS